MISGETYEYMALEEPRKVEKLGNMFAGVPNKDQLQFMELNKVKIESVLQTKMLFQQL